jgi:hypothetical protein
VNAPSPQQDVHALLARLHTQLRLLIPALTVTEGGRQAEVLLARMRESTNEAAHTLSAVEPVVLAAIEAAMRHAVAGEHDEARTELLNAYHRLSVLIHREPRRAEAAHERTRRWRVSDGPTTPGNAR